VCGVVVIGFVKGSIVITISMIGLNLVVFIE
jgi:hypothetical protein